MILDEYTHFPPHLFVTVVCVIGPGSFNMCVCVCVCVYINVCMYTPKGLCSESNFGDGVLYFVSS